MEAMDKPMQSRSFTGVMAMFGCDAPGMEEGDYVGTDELLYCGKCHTRKQTRIKDERFRAIWNGKDEFIFPTVCECRKAELEEEEAERKRREEQQRVDELRRSSLIDDKFADSTFEQFEVNAHNARPNKLARRYAERFGEMLEKNQGLLFHGNPGTGKTFTAACIANALLDRRTPLIMTSFVKLLNILGKLNSSEGEEATIRRMNNARLLIIDDLGAERNTDYALERVYNIVDSRYRAKKPMILTTNLTVEEMQTTPDIRYQRIYDRVFEVCYPVEFTGPSWRYAEASRRYEAMNRLLED
ncbi:ATP-binding protein [Eubacteriales bacterium OttesenSCG-928-N13]|nr:ATP-binding protein [Eubacteriales bacterium OttesenSCG-928-N13]